MLLRLRLSFDLVSLSPSEFCVGDGGGGGDGGGKGGDGGGGGDGIMARPLGILGLNGGGGIPMSGPTPDNGGGGGGMIPLVEAMWL